MTITINGICKCNKSSSYIITSEIDDVTTHRICDKCDTAIIISCCELTPKLINNQIGGAYPQNKCLGCNASGFKFLYKFKKCENCDATGGIVCTKCNGSGSIFKNYESCIDLNLIRSIHVQSCGCDNGYKIKCHVCKGQKSNVSEKTQVVCTKCVKIE